MIVLEDNKKREFTAVAFSPDARLVAAGGGNKEPVIWEAATGRELHRLDFVPPYTTTSLAFHPTRPLLHVATTTGIVVHSLDTRQCRRVPSRLDVTQCVAFDPTGRRVLWHHYRDRDSIPLAGHYLNCAALTKSGEYRRVWQRPGTDPPHDGWADCLAFLPDGERFVAAETDTPGTPRAGRRFVIRAAATGDAILSVSDPATACVQVSVSPRGDLLATRCGTAIHVFDLADLAVLRKLPRDGRKHFTGIAFHPSGRYLAAASNDATVKLYDTATWQAARTYTWDIGRMRSIAFSPDGTLAAAGSDTGQVVVWDVDI